MKSRLFLMLVPVTLLLLVRCGSGRPEIITVDPAFGEYVSSYTSGMVSRQANIRVQLNNLPVSGIKTGEGNLLRDSTLLEDIFEFEPAIAGRAVWVDDQTIEFIPDKALPSDQFYDVHFDLERLANVKEGFEDFHFQFSSYKQTIFVSVEGLYDYDAYNLEWKQLRGRIGTADYADSAALTKVLTATYNGKKLPVRLEQNSDETNNIYFYVDSIERTTHPGEVILSWNGEPIKALQKGQVVTNVSKLGDFSVTNVQVIDREDQSVELVFSEPIAQQDLNGLITIEGMDKLVFAINYNSVIVYLPNRGVGMKNLKVAAGILNVRGHAMNEAFSEEIELHEPKPLVRIQGNGSILPNSNGLIFPFEAISLKSVDVRVIKIYENNVHNFLQINDLNGNDGLTRFGKVIARKKIRLDYDKSMDLKQWNSHVIDLNKMISADPGAIYRVSIKFSKKDAICDCPEEEEDNESTNERSYDDEWSEESWHGYGFDEGFDSWYDYNDEYMACEDSYYYGKAVSRNILASDLGMLFKLDGDKVSHAFINDMLTTDPVANVEVQYFDFTRQLITSGTTNSEGMLDVKLSRKPFLMIAKRGKQRGYLKLGDGYSNSLSQFDIEGEQAQDGVKGYIYGERGVWRPGDSLFLTLIVQDLLHTLPVNHPVKFELMDPNGQIVSEFTKTANVNGSYDFRTQTGYNAPTGYYTATAKIGNRVFSKGILIETVKPNRLKIRLDIDPKIARDSLAHLSVKWLHGAIAKHLRTNITVSVSSMKTRFAAYKDYVFDSPVRYCSSEKETVHDGLLNDEGEALVRTKLHTGSTAPGMLRASFVTRVFEKGGDFSIDRQTTSYSPFKTYVGLEIPTAEGGEQSLVTDKNHRLNIVTVNEDGKPVSTGRLQVKIYKVEWRWWYERGSEDLAEYISRAGVIIVKDTLIEAKNGKTGIDFRVNYPEYGRYLVTVTDLDGQHQTGQTITVDWPSWNRGNRKENSNPGMLSFACDKETYTKGEQVKISFPSPADGRALISVETSRKVITKFWVKTVKGETTHSFTATADMAPNAYVHITMIQPHATTKNDSPIRMYGVIPIMVEDPLTHLHPQIDMPDEVRPESTTTIRVNEQNGRKMTYTLDVVDEGLLDLTGFRTPQPWATFYAREALGVRTWDMYDYVIGAYAGKLDKLLSIGGDGGLEEGEGAKANRFKPVVTHLGPFTLEAGQSAAHKVTLPNYMGSVRVMVVAQNEGAYGNAEKAVLVKKPLMLLATLPRVLGPGEEVELPVDVFAMEKSIKNVKVTVECNDLAIIGQKTQSMAFTEIGDEVVNFKVKMAERTGVARFKITAVSGKETAVQEIEIDVRTPNPTVTTGQEIVLEPGKEWSGDLRFTGIAGTNKATVEISSLPAIGLEKRLDYLIQYPHGCIEQTTSAAFPQLYVGKLINLDTKQQEKSAANVKAALKRLQLFQTSGGGFGYWPGESEDSEWGTNYAGHFMIEAEQQGYSLPGNLKARWVKFQKERAKNWNPEENFYVHSHGKETNELIQAYRLYVLALSKNPETGAMNRLREQENLCDAAKWRLASAYEITGQQEIAKKLVANLKTTVAPYSELSYSYGSDARDQAMILESLSLMNSSKAAAVAKDVSKRLASEEWLSTQETAYSLLAMCTYAGLKGDLKMQYSFRLNDNALKPSVSEKRIHQVIYTEKDFAKKARVTYKNTGNATLYIKVMVEGKPLVGDKSSASNNLGMKLRFLDMDGKVIHAEKLTQGTDFIAEVTITNPGKAKLYKEMALTQIFPSGWEIHNARLDGTYESDAARYQDIRDDRVYSYYEIAPGESKTFRIQLNATYLGKFYLPATYSEAMYDHLINAHVPGKWVQVVSGA